MVIATAADAIAFIEAAITRPSDSYDVLPPRLRQIARYPYMAALMAELGHPEAGLRVAHIAGTSGKGSTAMMLSAIAQAGGIRTGLYTSPYVTIPQERIQIAGTSIANDLFIASTAQVAAALDRLTRRLPDFAPHVKMIWVAIMLVAFAHEQVELAVIEVGKGGRYDETNVVQPTTATLVSIGLDHTESLGDTLAEIAFHKAGIIKPGASVISGVVAPAPRGIIEAEARLAGAMLHTIDTDFSYDALHLSSQETHFHYREQKGGDIRDCQLRLIGQHYGHNAALAIRTARTLLPMLPDAAIRAGLRQAWLPGRFEVVRQHPTVILDIAHNPDKLSALVATVLATFPATPIWLVFATMANKDSSNMLATLLPLQPVQIICTEARLPGRAVASAAALAAQSTSLGLVATVAREPQEAVAHAMQSASRDGLVLVTGSLYLVSQVRATMLPVT
jgi:dihydrofolate synthase / folylpolyglutamate synthase